MISKTYKNIKNKYNINLLHLFEINDIYEVSNYLVDTFPNKIFIIDNFTVLQILFNKIVTNKISILIEFTNLELEFFINQISKKHIIKNISNDSIIIIYNNKIIIEFNKKKINYILNSIYNNLYYNITEKRLFELTLDDKIYYNNIENTNSLVNSIFSRIENNIIENEKLIFELVKINVIFSIPEINDLINIFFKNNILTKIKLNIKEIIGIINLLDDFQKNNEYFQKLNEYSLINNIFNKNSYIYIKNIYNKNDFVKFYILEKKLFV